MATIKVNSKVMREKSNTFEAVAKSVKGYTAEMLNEVESLRAYWEGDAAEATVKKFKSLNDKFEEIVKTIESYSSFLENAAQVYEKTEAANAGTH